MQLWCVWETPFRTFERYKKQDGSCPLQCTLSAANGCQNEMNTYFSQHLLKLNCNNQESHLETEQTPQDSNSLPLHWQPWPWCQQRPNSSTPFPWLLQQASVQCPALCPNMSSALWQPHAHQSDSQNSGAMGASLLRGCWHLEVEDGQFKDVDNQGS